MSGPAKNKLGLWASTSLVIGNMIGAGVFLMPATLAGFGGISLFGWLFSAIGAFFLARVFSNLSKLMPGMSGGPYAYTHAGFGDFAGFIIAWGYWISVWCTNATLAVSFTGGLSTFFKSLQQNPLLEIITGLGAIWLLTWVNTLGIKATGNMQLVTTILKLMPLLFVAIAGIFFIKAGNFTPFNISGTSNMQAITASSTLTLFAFLGIECATIPAGNVINPEKTIPRATTIGTLITTTVYILVTVVVMGMIPAAQLQNSATPLADAAMIIGGEKARYLVGAGVALAAFGALNGWILVQGQIPAAVAKDKLFPGIFSRENKVGVPATGIVIGSILASVLMYMNYNQALVKQYAFLSLMSTLTCLVPYLFCAAAYAIIAIAKKQLPVNKWPGAIMLATASFAFSIWAIIGSTANIVYWGFILLMGGVPFYVWIIYKKESDH
ncbi:MAG TPA: amino acid permease [Chitinophagaceae bacterium]|nr:amino acid permease [Chitinophagaceae bacterium]